ncbi:MAG: NAD(P)/FAD-dependent oxidoreductase, partial [Alphaproteobacteria bacterium]
VETARGRVVARDAIVATDGYALGQGGVLGHLRRRIIPIRTYIAATEPVPDDVARQVLPGGRPVIDTHKVVFHIQPSPDGERILFGGRAGRDDGSLEATAGRLHRHFARLFPALEGVRVSHCWDGFFGFSFDQLPHIGAHDGVHYALGYCGTGIPLGTYLGHKLALRVLGAAGAETAFDERRFPTIPLYTGEPWFLPALVRYYAFRDSLPG